jgi:hypothetical protein
MLEQRRYGDAHLRLVTGAAALPGNEVKLA